MKTPPKHLKIAYISGVLVWPIVMVANIRTGQIVSAIASLITGICMMFCYIVLYKITMRYFARVKELNNAFERLEVILDPPHQLLQQTGLPGDDLHGADAGAVEVLGNITEVL